MNLRAVKWPLAFLFNYYYTNDAELAFFQFVSSLDFYTANIKKNWY
jgi:hypothetical protein